MHVVMTYFYFIYFWFSYFTFTHAVKIKNKNKKNMFPIFSVNYNGFLICIYLKQLDRWKWEEEQTGKCTPRSGDCIGICTEGGSKM